MTYNRPNPPSDKALNQATFLCRSPMQNRSRPTIPPTIEMRSSGKKFNCGMGSDPGVTTLLFDEKNLFSFVLLDGVTLLNLTTLPDVITLLIFSDKTQFLLCHIESR